jgi:signal peptidase I
MVLLPRILFLALAIFGAEIVRGECVVIQPTTTVSLDTALSDAQKVADMRPGSQVMRIEGKSMLPFFGEGSVVVVKKIDAARLRAGMVVVYINRFGETVAHRLVAATEQGWVAQGYNNTEVDSTLVTAENLTGVVYATFHSNGQTELASLVTKTPTALAAPAH